MLVAVFPSNFISVFHHPIRWNGIHSISNWYTHAQWIAPFLGPFHLNCATFVLFTMYSELFIEYFLIFQHFRFKLHLHYKLFQRAFCASLFTFFSEKKMRPKSMHWIRHELETFSRCAFSPNITNKRVACIKSLEFNTHIAELANIKVVKFSFLFHWC